MVAQQRLADHIGAMAEGECKGEAAIPGEPRRSGASAMIENTVNSTTGMVTVRATMQNENETLWPGTWSTPT